MLRLGLIWGWSQQNGEGAGPWDVFLLQDIYYDGLICRYLRIWHKAFRNLGITFRNNRVLSVKWLSP